MKTRRLGKTGHQVSEIGFGAWGIGADWGAVDDRESLAAMHAAVDAGVTFFDTADVYGDGRSERLVGQLLRERSEPLVVATKFGRRAPLDVANYTYENFRGWIERSRENLGVETVDLVQLHSPPVGDVLHAVGLRGMRPPRRRTPRAGVRGQRREGGAGAEGDRVSGRRHGADRLQRLSAAAGGALLPAGGRARRRRDRARPARIRPADGEVRPDARASPRTTTAPTTVTASPSMPARPSRGWTSGPASRRSMSCGRSCRRGRPSRSSRCAGSSTSTRSRPSSRAPRRRSRRVRTRPRPGCRRYPSRRAPRSPTSIGGVSLRRSSTGGSAAPGACGKRGRRLEISIETCYKRRSSR